MYVLPIWASHLAIIAPFAVSLLFAVLYTLKAPWWHSWMGRNLFLFDAAIVLATLPGFLEDTFHVNDGTEFFQWLTVGVLVAVALLVVQRIYLLFKEQKGWNWVRASRRIEDVPLPDVREEAK